MPDFFEHALAVRIVQVFVRLAASSRRVFVSMGSSLLIWSRQGARMAAISSEAEPVNWWVAGGCVGWAWVGASTSPCRTSSSGISTISRTRVLEAHLARELKLTIFIHGFWLHRRTLRLLRDGSSSVMEGFM